MLGGGGNSSLIITILLNQIGVFLSAVVCSKPLTCTVMSLRPDLFQREVYCTHISRSAQGRAVNNVNMAF